MCHTSYITVHCTQSVLYCVHNIVPWEHFSNISTKFKPPPFASICRCYTDPPLLSAKTLFNVARQCYFEMKTNKEPCFSILSIIILCPYPTSPFLFPFSPFPFLLSPFPFFTFSLFSFSPFPLSTYTYLV